jgi:hypothetical protein
VIYFDTETCGLHGMAVMIQYAEDDGPVHLHSVWTQPIENTLALIEKMCQTDVMGFNLAFDWFHICKLYTILNLVPDRTQYPDEIIDEIAELEPMGRDGPCCKPRSAFDIMLHARKGPYQSTMDRGDIRIRRVPTPLAWQLADELEKRIPLSDIYFGRRKDKLAKKWQIYDLEDQDGEMDPNFKDIVLKFAPTTALKALAVNALKLPVDSVLLFTDIEIDSKHYPEEFGYAPFAKAVGTRRNWKGAWPEKIRHHIAHWNHHELARKYACKDVEYVRDLYKHFGCPPIGDDDSVLACMVGAVRWRGYAVDIPGLKALKEATLKSKTKIVNGEEFSIPTQPKQARIYIEQVMDETEKLVASDHIQKALDDFEISTKKVLLQTLSNWKIDCPSCKGAEGGCSDCSNSGECRHPAALRAEEVLNARQANYEADLYDKFILAGRFHASFKVIGALSSRMAGTDGLNAQGIKKTKQVRSKFPLAPDGYDLSGGDFAGFEVTLAEAEYNDENLRKQLLTCEKCSSPMEWHLDKNDFICTKCGSNKGKKIHALFGVHVFPEHDYFSLKATEGTANDKYTKAKSGIFAMMYGGTIHTLMDRLGVPEDVATAALRRFHKEFPGVGKSQSRINNMFCSMRQTGGIGTRVEWHEPADFIESMFGFRRYFTLENAICKTLFTLANNPPKHWRDIKIRVQRRDRFQTAMGAVQSALYAAAFGLQASNTRAANNHVIQSSGATMTKTTERNVWEVQPHGIHKFRVIPMNIHDEIMCPTLSEYVDDVAKAVRDTVEGFRKRVPLIKMDWAKKLNTWADKS